MASTVSGGGRAAGTGYNFKGIHKVPLGNEFIDIILSKTQRRTPTVIHKGYSIGRIRAFYMRKVKYTQSNFNDKLSTILTDFPNLTDIHPFYAALMNVLYDRDHYKLALGQLNMARRLVDTVARDYLRMLKYGDSLFRCKSLKRAALGRMCTVMKRQSNNLAYLEEVRQHLARLPSINPSTRTLIVCGYPNVGKSSFLKACTRAEVDVQPYAFTTRSLFVGHMFYNFTPWQVIDTPGLLDHPLPEMNTIEMQSVTALAHINAAVLFFVDISEECSYTIEQQVNLFKNISPLFTGKPLTIVLNKIDVKRPENLSPEDQALLQGLVTSDIEMMACSTMSGEGLTEVRTSACDRLLAKRVEAKLHSRGVDDFKSRLHIAVPADYDASSRPPLIPDAVLEKMRQSGPAQPATGVSTRANPNRRTHRDLEVEAGGAGQYSIDMREKYIVDNEEERYDVFPEFYMGHNVADFLDPDIEAALDRLEAEEEAREAALAADEDMESDEDERAQRKKAVAIIRTHNTLLKKASQAKHGRNRPLLPRTHAKINVESMTANLEAKGVDPSAALERLEEARGRSRSRTRASIPQRVSTHDAKGRDWEEGRHKGKSEAGASDEQEGGGGGDVDMDAGDASSERRLRRRSASAKGAAGESESGEGERKKRRRSLSAGDRNVVDPYHAEYLRKATTKKLRVHGRQGEADRHISVKMPKHLFAGKMSNGKRDSR